MSELEIRIVELEPLRVACVNAYGASPEQDSWQSMETWAKPKGLLEVPGLRTFGYNNPNPSPGTPNYGYDFWITVGPEIEAEGEMESLVNFLHQLNTSSQLLRANNLRFNLKEKDSPVVKASVLITKILIP